VKCNRRKGGVKSGVKERGEKLDAIRREERKGGGAVKVLGREKCWWGTRRTKKRTGSKESFFHLGCERGGLFSGH
jgi:hypothetical protein